MMTTTTKDWDEVAADEACASEAHDWEIGEVHETTKAAVTFSVCMNCGRERAIYYSRADDDADWSEVDRLYCERCGEDATHCAEDCVPAWTADGEEMICPECFSREPRFTTRDDAAMSETFTLADFARANRRATLLNDWCLALSRLAPDETITFGSDSGRFTIARVA